MAAPAARPRLHRDPGRRTVSARLEKRAASRASIASRSNSVPIIAVTCGEPAGIDRAIEGCKAGEFAALTTAPVHKGVINDGGIPFVGHTEYLAERTGAAQVVMVLAGGGLRVALATTHLALKDVPRALTREGLERTIRVLHAELIRRFGISAPRILVAGLNPHGGEGGYFGREEIEVIGPVLEKLR